MNRSSENLHISDSLEKFEQSLPRFDSASKHTSVRSLVRAQPKAGQWLLNRGEYISWKTGRSQSRLLWLNGIPGSGKTILFSRVLDNVRKIQDRNPRVAVLFFYCSENVNSADIFATLLLQLLRTIPWNVSPLLDAFELHELAGTIHELALVELMMTLGNAFKSTFVLIDGVDRCANLGDLLPDLCRIAQAFHVFVSSRNYPSIRNQLGADLEEVSISQENIEDDMRNFVQVEMEGLELQNPMLRESIVHGLVQGAQGSFFWVSDQIRALRGVQSNSEVEQVLATTPPGMVKIFVEALESMDSKPHSDLLFSMLRLGLLANSPMTSRALAEAIKTHNIVVSPALVDTMSLIDDCGGLLICVPAAQKIHYKHYWPSEGSDTETWDVSGSEDDDIVVPFHSSLKHFLLAHPVMLPAHLAHWTLHPLNVAHDSIARLCLAHLNLMLEQVDREVVVELPNCSFAQYALYHWVSHVRASGKDIEDFRDLVANGTIPGLVHMAVRLNMTINKALPKSMYAAVDGDGLSPLHIALEISAPLAIVDWLLKNTDVNQVNQNGATPLHFAVLYHQNPKEPIERLLAAGADIHAKTEEGLTALHTLLQRGVAEHIESCILVMLEHRADVNARDDYSRTPLHTLAQRADQIDSLKLVAECLMKHGAEVDALDQEGRTPLHWAVQGGCVFLVSSLLKNGASIDVVDDGGDPPLTLIHAQLLLDHDTKISDVRLCPGTPLIAGPRGRSAFADASLLSKKQTMADREDRNRDSGCSKDSYNDVFDDDGRRFSLEDDSSVVPDTLAEEHITNDLAIAQLGKSNQRLVAELKSSRLKIKQQSVLITSLRQQLSRAAPDARQGRRVPEDPEKDLISDKKDGSASRRNAECQPPQPDVQHPSPQRIGRVIYDRHPESLGEPSPLSSLQLGSKNILDHTKNQVMRTAEKRLANLGKDGNPTPTSVPDSPQQGSTQGTGQITPLIKDAVQPLFDERIESHPESGMEEESAELETSEAGSTQYRSAELEPHHFDVPYVSRELEPIHLGVRTKTQVAIDLGEESGLPKDNVAVSQYHATSLEMSNLRPIVQSALATPLHHGPGTPLSDSCGENWIADGLGQESVQLERNEAESSQHSAAALDTRQLGLGALPRRTLESPSSISTHRGQITGNLEKMSLRPTQGKVDPEFGSPVTKVTRSADLIVSVPQSNPSQSDPMRQIMLQFMAHELEPNQLPIPKREPSTLGHRSHLEAEYSLPARETAGQVTPLSKDKEEKASPRPTESKEDAIPELESPRSDVGYHADLIASGRQVLNRARSDSRRQITPQLMAHETELNQSPMPELSVQSHPGSNETQSTCHLTTKPESSKLGPTRQLDLGSFPRRSVDSGSSSASTRHSQIRPNPDLFTPIHQKPNHAQLGAKGQITPHLMTNESEPNQRRISHGESSVLSGTKPRGRIIAQLRDNAEPDQRRAELGSSRFSSLRRNVEHRNSEVEPKNKNLGQELEDSKRQVDRRILRASSPLFFPK